MNSFSDILSYTHDIDGWLADNEGYFLYKAAMGTKNEIVEIGSWKGKSTAFLALGTKEVKGKKVTAIDPHKGTYSSTEGFTKEKPTFNEFLKNMKKRHLTSFITPIVATSEDAAKMWKKRIGLLFIDGLHFYNYAKQDYLLWSRFLSEGGIIAFHDGFWGAEGVEKVIQEYVLYNTQYSEFGVVGSIFYARKKRATTVKEKINSIVYKVLFPLSQKIYRSTLPPFIKFLFFKRIFDILLYNTYTSTYSLLEKSVTQRERR